MLTPVPTTTVPTAPGTTPLPLPHGAEAAQTRAQHALPQTLTAQQPSRPASGAPPPSTPPPAAENPAQAAQTRAGSATLPLPETTLASGATAAQPGASTATPGSLVAAQMLGMETAPLQALLAQQAATRALPHPVRRSEPRPDAPAAATDHTPDDTFDPKAPHLPQTLHGHHSANSSANMDEDSLEVDEAPEDAAPERAETRRDVALHPPPPDALPGTAITPWVLAGAVFVGTFSLTLLLLA
ncbi:hypothetical protein C8J27_102326 [Rhodobacter aestuarii]|uniref:Uncharacterized protein n=1 Tax=Rhodobacter aestuarii TaxID=453582 RepID=A0A1N7MU45_9RHOB|nr:hypothetical protein [Rhodobacter aestuarii]PTV96527.1 hypothetical protein C8J27_102326 [Rhodobacter aestuarii]SIS89655.1 hypothetical protein SAMN05421580_106195 [Rhodobacter aestuarii]